MDTLLPAIIGAIGVVLGVLLTSAGAILTHHLTGVADRERWQRETNEANRTRFHDKRLDVYTQFLAAVPPAYGQALALAIDLHRKYTEGGEADLTPAMIIDYARLSEAPDVSKNSLRDMGLLQAQVALLASSHEVRITAKELRASVAAFLVLRPDAPHWNDAMVERTTVYETATERFQDAARRELGGAV